MDIRNFFVPKTGKSAKPKAILNDDDDDFKKFKSKKELKGLIFESDGGSSSNVKKSKASSHSFKTMKNVGKESKLNEVTPDDFFGSRSSKPVKKERLVKRKASADEAQSELSKVIIIDEDIDFDGALNSTPTKKVKKKIAGLPTEKTLARKGVVCMAKNKGDFESTLVFSDCKIGRGERNLNSLKVKGESVQCSSKTPVKLKAASKLNTPAEDSFSIDFSKMKPSPVKSSEASIRGIQKRNITPLKEKKNNMPRKAASEKKGVTTLKVTSESSTLRKVTLEKEDCITSRNIMTEKKSNKPIEAISEKSRNIPIKETSVTLGKTEDEEKNEGSMKQQRYARYLHWQNRSGPKAPGSKEIPEGADNCLEGLTFVLTGTLESLERDEAKSLIERYGGKVTGSVSGRTSYVIVGDDPGESKIEKARQQNTKQIDENRLLELIRTMPGKKSKYEIEMDKEIERASKMARKNMTSMPNKSEPKVTNLTGSTENKAAGSTGGFYSKTRGVESPTVIGLGARDSLRSASPSPDSLKTALSSQPDSEFLLWVDKYKPKTLKQIIGQQSAKSNVEKLKTWLMDWHKNNRPQDGSKPKPKPKVNMWGGGGDPTGAGFKAALLSGPPGIGKTTTATLVCQEFGFHYIELNASDTRSKRTLNEKVQHMLDNSSITTMFGTEEQRKSAANGTKNALIMDEIDGMAGNEDRGGMQEVIQLIKTTKIPIICMCNDRSSPKIRSLTNHCFDLRFQRPRVEQITSAMMSICFKEGLKIQAPALQALIRGCNQDVRQILYNLSMLKSSNKTVSYDDATKHADESHKDVAMGIFDVARKLLTSESVSLSVNDKLSLFFMDYSMIPLFVQDNYPMIRTASAAGNIHRQLAAISRAADSIALGDRVDKILRSDQAWNALPTLGLLSTVVPCDIMKGGMSGMINFPSFFGKLSTTGKNHRLLQELKFHSSLSTEGANEETFNTDYLPYLRWRLTNPLIEQSRTGEAKVRETLELLQAYSLLKEDFDSIVDIGQYPGKPQLMAKVETKVKSAFTRGYNKEVRKTPYAVLTTAKKTKKTSNVTTDLGYGMEDTERASLIDEEEVDEDELDAMVKAKPSRNKTASSSKAKKSSESRSKRGKKK